jgi:hypothetical protein
MGWDIANISGRLSVDDKAVSSIATYTYEITLPTRVDEPEGYLTFEFINESSNSGINIK